MYTCEYDTLRYAGPEPSLQRCDSPLFAAAIHPDFPDPHKHVLVRVNRADTGMLPGIARVCATHAAVVRGRGWQVAEVQR